MSARSNGLSAHAYSVLLEIEESLGDRMLQALAERQIAAYVLPTTGPGGIARLLLHVDSQRRVPAGIVLAGLTPAHAGELPAESESVVETPENMEPVEPSGEIPGAAPDEPPAVTELFDEAAFAEIVAGFHREPTERSWPAAEDLPPEREEPASSKIGPYGGIDRRRPSISVTPDIAADRAERNHLDDVDAERYVPEPLAKLTPHPPMVRWAFAGLFLGLALLLLPTLLALGHRTSLDIAGVLCVIGSAAMLLSRLRDRSPDDDDGAVV
jgi:hypothetical protein